MTEALIEFQWNDRFRELVEISPKDVRSVVYGVSGPVESLSISVGRVKGYLELFYTLLAPCKSEDAFNVRCCELLEQGIRFGVLTLS